MKRIPVYLIIICIAAVFASCSQKQKAKTTIKDFVETNISKQADYSFSDFGKLDSTRYVTDSIIIAMRLRAQQDAAFNKSIDYTNRPKENKQLKYMAVKMSVNDADTTYTFYLTNDLEKVVSFK